IFRSTDGTTWTEVQPANFPATYHRVALSLAPSNPNVLYLLAEGTGTPTDHSLWKYTYLSGDGSGSGGAWVDRSDALAHIPVAADNNSWDYSSQGGYDIVVRPKPDDENTLMIGGVHLIRSTDAFATTNQRTWIGGWLYPNPNAQVYETHADQ